MLTGERPERPRDARVRRRADPARRPRAERLDVRGPRGRGDAHRHPLGDRRRHRRAEGPAARRRERRRDAAAARDRRRTRRSRRSRRSFARSWRGRRRSRASATASTTPRIRAPRTCGRCRAISASAPASRSGSRCRSASKRWSRREKKLNPNVDFYSASTYYVLGIPIDLFTPIFAVSRVSGWTAHVLEQYANNRLIRPRADYIGPEYPQRYATLENDS